MIKWFKRVIAMLVSARVTELELQRDQLAAERYELEVENDFLRAQLVKCTKAVQAGDSW